MKRYYILAGVLSISAIIGSIYGMTDNEFKDAPTQIAGCTDPAITAIVYSIQNNPAGWERDSFQMWHDDDVSIWTANEDYGLSITMGGKEARPDEYEMSDQCRVILYDTTQAWLRKTLNEKLRS